jgi:hypothetical protein
MRVVLDDRQIAAERDDCGAARTWPGRSVAESAPSS